MFEVIRKRDGREVPFDYSKITDAIFKAALAVGGEDRETAMRLTLEVLGMLKAKYNGTPFGVEDVQDLVEKALIEAGHAKTAKAYILYRSWRTRIREAKGDLMDAVEEILEETSRENANVSNSPSAKMLQVAEAASKKYYLSRLIPEDYAQAHVRGDIHIHDLGFYAKTLNCIQIPLGKLLGEGFNTGHGYIRPPKRPGSATALACIILQSSQNDMFGGQSFGFFDRDMAPYVENATDDEVYQSMEALVYNLNSMHSLKGSERIWVFDNRNNRLGTVSMEEFHQRFEQGRYMALSLNYHSGRTELKNITASLKHPNFNRLLQVKLKSGQRVAVTDNHSLMTVNDQGEITTTLPEFMKVGLTPARWTVVEKQHVCSLSKYPVSRKYPLGWVALDEDLARFLGFYVAEGSVDGSSIYLALFDTDLEKLVTDILKKVDHRFSVRIRQDTKGVKRDMVCNVGKRFAAFVADICGRGAANKRVPTELFFAPTNVIRAFLDGYLSGDGTVGTNRVAAGTVSEELRDGVLLLLARLGLVASVGQETPKSQFAVMNERFKIAVGGYYATALSLSGRKEESLADLYRVTTEQTPYDYEYLRPLIAKVYGVKSRNAHQYRIKPLYIEELIADLKSRILTDSEKDLVEKLATLDFWFKELSNVINDIESTERHHLRRLIGEKRLPRFCNYLPVFLPYEDWLGRFLLPLDLGLSKRGGRIHNDCRSPGLVMRWARAVLERNEAMGVLLEKLERAFEIRPVRVAAIDELPHEPYVYDISVDGNENFLTAQGIFVHNSRAGAQVPFSSINLGTETGEAARKVTRNLLLAYEAGLGRNEAPIFPNIIFRVKKGVNFNQGDPNHDLFQLAVRVAAKRLNPTFSFMDAGFNAPYGEQVSYMGCRSRVMANRRGPEVTEGRGNLSFTTMNLPRIAVKAERDVNKFFKLLDAVAELGIRQLYHRYELQAKLKVKDIPFVMGQSLYMGAAGLKPEQSVAEAIKHGTLSLGFIGLAEALVALLGKHHGQDAGAQELGIEIVSWLRRKIDEACDKYDLNYTLLATPAEGTAGRFIKPDRREFGIVPGVNDKDYYTNSFHVPVHFPIECFRKIEIEGPYHKFCNAGHISYVELPSPPVENPEAVEAIVRYMAEQDMGYVGVNFPVDFCESCSFAGVLDDECPKCGSTAIRRVRRITGYLSTVDRFNDAKVAELKSRLVHLGRPGTLQ